MAEPSDERRAITTKADLDAVTIGGARWHGGPVRLVEYDDDWPRLFEREAARIREALGKAAISIEHVGSTSVPTLSAKPIIDIVLEVPDSSDEASYVPPLESRGYELRIREPEWWQHRMFKGPDTDVNLHVFSADCPEVVSMLLFRDHLHELARSRVVRRVQARAGGPRLGVRAELRRREDGGDPGDSCSSTSRGGVMNWHARAAGKNARIIGDGITWKHRKRTFRPR